MNEHESRSSGGESQMRGVRSQTGSSQFGESRSSRSHNPAAGEMKQAAKQAARRARETAGEAVHEARDRAESALDQQLEAASSRLDHVADAIEHTASELDDDPMMANLAHRAAEGVHNISGYLREHDLRDLVDQVEDFARRHPVWFLGGLFVAGMVTARLLKSTTAHNGGAEGGYEGENDSGFEGRGFEGDSGYGSQEFRAGAAAGKSAMANEGGRWEGP